MSLIIPSYFTDTVYVRRLFINGSEFIPPAPIIGTNTFYGQNAGAAITTATNSSGFGFSALQSLSTGTGATTVGASTYPLLASINTPLIAMGANVGTFATGDANLITTIAIGNNVFSDAAYVISANTVVVGHNSCSQAGTVNLSTVLGNGNLSLSAQVLGGIVVGANNSAGTATFVESVLISNNVGTAGIANFVNSTVVGLGAAASATSVNRATLFGYRAAGQAANLANRVLAIGADAVGNSATLDTVIAIGDSAGAGAQLTNSLVIGHLSATTVATCNDTVILGNDCCAAGTLAVGNVFIGRTIVETTNSAVGNIAIGANILNTVAVSSENIVLGGAVFSAAGGTNITRSVVLGNTTCSAITAVQNLLSIGNNNLSLLVTSPDNCTLVGNETAVSATTFTQSTLCGYGVVENTTSVTGSALFGYRIAADSTGVSNTLAAGINSLIAAVSVGNVVALGNNILGDTIAVTDSTYIGNGITCLNGLRNTVIGGASGSVNPAANSDNTVVGTASARVTALLSGNVLVGNNTGALRDPLLPASLSDTIENSIGIGNNALSGASVTNVIAIGPQTASNMVSGSNSIAIGQQNLRNKTSSGDVAVGFAAMNAISGGVTSNNAAYGALALTSLNTGTLNVGVGFDSGGVVLGTANSCTLVGAGTRVPDGATNANAFGSGAVAPASNSLRLGNTAITLIEAQVAVTVTSDARAKVAVTDLDEQKANILQLLQRVQIRGYQLPNDHRRRAGVIAQELAADIKDSGVSLDIVEVPESAEAMLSVRYDDLFSLLLVGYQDAIARIAALEAGTIHK